MGYAARKEIMKKLFSLFLFCLTIIFLTGNIFPAQAVEKSENIADYLPNWSKGPHFQTGELVSLNETWEGDLYVAGGKVEINGIVMGDVLAAGGNVEISGEVTGDVRLAGGQVDIDGQVGGSVTAVGGMVSFGPKSIVGKNVVAAGGLVHYEGQIGGNVLTAGETVVLAGEFAGDVKADSAKLQVSDDAVILGNLLGSWAEEAEVSSEARISGENQLSQNSAKMTVRPEIAKTGILAFFAAFKLAAAIVGFFMGLLGGSAMLYFLPRQTAAVLQKLQTKALDSLVIGLAVLLFVPILSVVLIVTILGIPLAGILILEYLLVLALAGWAGALFVGSKLVKALKWPADSRYREFILGLFVVQAVGLIPVVGDLTKFIVFLLGFGAIYAWIVTQLRQVVK